MDKGMLRLLPYAAAALVAAALLAQALLAHAASAEAGGGSTNLTKEIRSLLAAVKTRGLGEEKLAKALAEVARCYGGRVAAAARDALEALRGHNPDELRAALQRLALYAAEEAGAPRCPRVVAAHSLYTAVLAAFYQPTGFGVLIPLQGVSAPLPPRLGGRLCGPHGYAAAVAAAAAGWLDDAMARGVLNETSGGPCLVAAAAAAGPPPQLGQDGGTALSQRLALEAVSRYYLDQDRVPPGSPGWVFEDAVGLIRRGERAEALGLLHLLEAAYPGYAAVLSAFAASNDPLAYYASKRAAGVPRLELPAENPYCVAEAMLARLLGGSALEAPRSQLEASGALELLGEAASLCYAATGRGIVELLKANPLAPLDPDAVALGPPGPQQALAKASQPLPRRLDVPLAPQEAALILRRAGLAGLTPRQLIEAEVELKPLLERLSRARGSPELLGYLVRAVSLRWRSNGTVLSYASARLAAWALLREGRVHFPNLVINDVQTPIDPYYVIFTVPGQQRLILWALGWVTSLEPPTTRGGEQQPGAGESGGNTGGPGGRGNGGQRQGGQGPPDAEKLEEIARALEGLPGGKPYADLVHEAAEAIRSGDYARAAAAAERLRKLLEAMVGKEAAQRLIREAARALGASPEELAKLLAEAASLKPSSQGASVDVKEATILARRLAAQEQEAGTGNKAGTPGRLIEAAAEIAAESAKYTLSHGEKPRPLRVEGLEWLLSNTGPGALFANITSLIAGIAGPRAGPLPAQGAGEQTGGGEMQLPLPPPPAPPRPPSWVRAAALAAVLLAAALLAARSGLLGRVLEAARLRRAEARLRGAAETRGEAGEAAAEAFAALLGSFEKLYRPRRRSETHREYGAGLRGGLGRLYWGAAAAYERLRFGHGGRGDLEALLAALREVRRLARRRGGAG